MNIHPAKNKKIERAFQDIPAATATSIVQKIELKRSQGINDPLFDIIMPLARKVLRKTDVKANRIIFPMRLFCDPFEDLLVDSGPSQNQHGRINRQSIMPVWNWIYFDLLPGRLPDLAENIEKALTAQNRDVTHSLTSLLYRESAKIIDKSLKKASKNEKSERKLAAQLGGATVFKDAQEIADSFRHYEAIAELRNRLPARLVSFDEEQQLLFLDLYNEFILRMPDCPGFIMATFISRLNKPYQCLRLAVNAIKTETGGVISLSPFGLIGDILIFDLEIAANNIVSELGQRAPADNVLENMKQFYELAAGFSEELEISPKSGWGRHIVNSRTRISEMLEIEIRKAPFLLRSYVKDRIKHGKLVDGDENSEELYENHQLIRILKLFEGCSCCRDQLSIHATMSKVKKEMQDVMNFARRIGEGQLITELEKKAASNEAT